jgi:hypothetical protein
MMKGKTFFSFFIALIIMSATIHVHADDSSLPEETSTWSFIQKKFRFRTFSEFMSPSLEGLSGKTTAVPTAEGGEMAPTNVFNIAWMDYEVAPNYRIVYWQRFNVFLAPSANDSGTRFIPRNPRFAFRRTNIFNSEKIVSTYDVYIQPGLAPEAASPGANRSFEFGIRTNTSYTFSDSKWSIGAVTETTGSLSTRGGAGADFYGWFMPWASYELSKIFSTQHYLTLNYMHNRGNSWSKLELDGLPFIQNGIGINVTEKIWAAIFLNNYLFPTPTLQNTWTSIWLSTSFL